MKKEWEKYIEFFLKTFSKNLHKLKKNYDNYYIARKYSFYALVAS